jgi:uncharacterized protein with LGFP repeats
VGLENCDEFAATNHCAGRFERGGNLGWVVSKVVVNLDAANLTVQFKATLSAAELGDTCN